MIWVCFISVERNQVFQKNLVSRQVSTHLKHTFICNYSAACAERRDPSTAFHSALAARRVVEGCR